MFHLIIQYSLLFSIGNRMVQAIMSGKIEHLYIAILLWSLFCLLYPLFKDNSRV